MTWTFEARWLALAMMAPLVVALFFQIVHAIVEAIRLAKFDKEPLIGVIAVVFILGLLLLTVDTIARQLASPPPPAKQHDWRGGDHSS